MPKPYKVKDFYFLKAKKEGLRARSAYKLEEAQIRFKLIKKNDSVLDLGSAPGSFLQKIHEFVGDKVEIIGIDLNKIENLPYSNIKLYQADISDLSAVQNLLGERKFDCITADLAPKTSGIKDLDVARSIDLNYAVLETAKIFLKKNGNLISKIFEGEDFNIFYRKFKNMFEKSNCFKPNSTRDRSREIFVIGRGFIIK
ncbi:hypothetical protein A2483_02400 [Candidatus Peregrinibacteria bacterium RIFOXYC2_FULL_33_13]|nr:MAG: Ribosomal RNA large subunit methyltransferase E [Candidatus Peregrinibacteria bacterium GW2011_GWA2_33_10]KKP41177.1 MAG: ribosomal RNA large subunit methyltransferase J [Candidatus Peregrinibacteria bacterium GW2011_GWC2_33_13]OGJ52661.1 MAG: hypothetical protein A2483_02400 [Candidatus Peregrinibacteria bacterium RIFOXYC2_FULL_33_13]